jgi:hypothetical protein
VRSWDERKSKACCDETAYGCGILALDGDLRLEPGAGAELVGECAQGESGFERYEWFVRDLQEADLVAPGETMSGWHRE